MKMLNVHEAKTHLSRILASVEEGESVIIGKAGKPIAVLSPYVEPKSVRRPGSLKGRIEIAEDFDADSELLADLFEGATKSQ